ncbi:MAG: hypothetical protein EOL95_04890 [Bacteroidia bacterium]|nr:hypothetical protein [Bacteroidia bacterium]
MNKPLQIVMTPVRNEAWVLPAFLTATSQWTDYIIIADQMSTDGSRELYEQFPTVVVIDNTNPNFNESERQTMLIAKAREVAAGRDTLLWGLDADEILAANTFGTNDWKRIITSKPGDVFYFKWAELSSNKKTYGDSVFYPWLFHDDGKEPHQNYVRNMHSMRIPYPIEEKQIYYVKDFRILHLAYLNPARIESKCRFYQFVDWSMNHRDPVSLSRNYSYNKKLETQIITNDMLAYDNFDLWDKVNCTNIKFWFDDYIIIRIANSNIKDVAKLDIWTKDFIKLVNISDPRSWIIKILHWYLRKTSKFKSLLIIRGIDKILKKIKL